MRRKQLELVVLVAEVVGFVEGSAVFGVDVRMAEGTVRCGTRRCGAEVGCGVADGGKVLDDAFEVEEE